MNRHPEHEAEQAYIERAYQRLDDLRAMALERAAEHARETTRMFGQGYDRDVSVGVALKRAAELDIGDESIIFGRIDAETGERYYIGRRNVADEDNTPLVIDWRVPAAEPFYRATGQEPLGLTMRRHFLCQHRTLLALEDEHFGEGTDLGMAGTGALLAALERPRTGTMRDIASTIRAEQDRIIRAPLEGILAIQGGPGTGKTAVALHRAAYLLFTHRRRLGQNGILFVGPNRLFLRYVGRVLPALGESGALMVMPEDLVEGIRVRATDEPAAARVKGDVRMIRVLEAAIADIQRRRVPDISFSFEGYDITLPGRDIVPVVKSLRRGRGTHNARHASLRRRLSARLYDAYRRVLQDREGRNASLILLPRKAGEQAIRADESFDAIADSIWPLLTPAALVGTLLSSPDALRSAARGILSAGEIESILRHEPDAWTAGDIALLDEARSVLGAPIRDRNPDAEDDLDEIETFAHVVADEVQDLTPMALRMLGRRARHASMTIVGDLAQSVGALPPRSWSEIIAHLDPRRGSAVEELTINYRTPGSIMDVAVRVLALAEPGIVPPTSVRDGGEPVEILAGPVVA
ncbi:MAG TPA: hypothetical protein VM841_12125, partial [Actinomycetota bacterium]|nr:hypothetical protein [Actinomycetota bacterium]